MNIKTHPCFNSAGYLKYSRIHLPVAPKCNIQCNYCNRKYDCVNENRPGVTSKVLTPQQAYEKYRIVKEKMPNLTVVGFAGPGDALANFEEVSQTVKLIKAYDPNINFCLSTNGLMLPHYAEDILNLGINFITVTINTINPEISKKIYAKGAEQLLENQLKGLTSITRGGAVVKVNIVAIKGVNDTCIEEVVQTVKEYGVYKTNIMPLIPVKDTVFQDNPIMSDKEICLLRKNCSAHIKQMYHCQRCRADAIGLLHEDRSTEFNS